MRAAPFGAVNQLAVLARRIAVTNAPISRRPASGDSVVPGAGLAESVTSLPSTAITARQLSPGPMAAGGLARSVIRTSTAPSAAST